MKYQLFVLIIFKFCLCASLNPPATGDAYANLTARLNALEQKVTTLTNAVDRDEKLLKQHINDSSHHTHVYFTAKLSGDLQGLGSHQVIHFGDVKAQEGYGYDTVTGLFTAPISGTYLFIANMMNNPKESSQLATLIMKNGVTTIRIPCNSGEDYAACSGTLVTCLSVGDRVWIEHIIGGTVDRASYFSGVLINID